MKIEIMHKFEGKAQTLLQLSTIEASFKIKPLLIVTRQSFELDPVAVCRRVNSELAEGSVIVRSNCWMEDSEVTSNAGVFLSLAHIDSADTAALIQALHDVFASYRTYSATDEAIVQEQVRTLSCCGVVFTQDPNRRGPYIIINYDECGSHDGVTSGKSHLIRTWVQLRGYESRIKSSNLKKIVRVTTELEKLFCSDALDIEFGIDEEGQFFVFQVRPIVFSSSVAQEVTHSVASTIQNFEKAFQCFNKQHPRVCGERAILSVMTDWNPAEIIGRRPKALATSLYRELVTDSIWAYQRDNYGYRNLRSVPLMVTFLGIPYIDVRASLNSFVPKQLSESLATKLVNYYCDALINDPLQHDKVEFNVVFSCFDWNLSGKLAELKASGFSENECHELECALKELTARIISSDQGFHRSELERIAKLESLFLSVTASELEPLDKIYWLIEDCKRYGTLPFAGLARAAFIATSFLRSFESLGILNSDDVKSFMSSLETVARGISVDSSNCLLGKLSKVEFLKKYGHLRPGTYDITSPRYDEAFEVYFRNAESPQSMGSNISLFELSSSQQTEISRLIQEAGLDVTLDQLFSFMREAIVAREHAKFVFSKNVSEILRLLSNYGSSRGLSPEDLSYLDIQTLLQMYSGLDRSEADKIIRQSIEHNRKMSTKTYSVLLPQFISSGDDFYGFSGGRAEPTYITNARIRGRVILEKELFTAELEEAIILLERADPGFDWLLSRGIAGLITMYGGANSHIAVRCAELQIPAVIGCGDDKFSEWAACAFLDIDCGAQLVSDVTNFERLT